MYSVYLARGGAIKGAVLDLAPREAVVATFEFSRVGITFSGWRGCRAYASLRANRDGVAHGSVNTAPTAPPVKPPPTTRPTPLLRRPRTVVLIAAAWVVLMLAATGNTGGTGTTFAALVFCAAVVGWTLIQQRATRRRPRGED
jgi:hypothetical protein